MKNKSQHIEEWINQYTGSLINRARYLVADKQDAEDIVQEVFVTAFESYDSFKKESQALTWLMGILKFKVADYYRKMYKKADNISLDRFFDQEGSWKQDDILTDWRTDDNDLLNDEDFKSVLETCLDALPEKWKIIVKLYYLEEKKTNVVCQETEISTTNLWKILQRSRLELRKCLDFKWFKNV